MSSTTRRHLASAKTTAVRDDELARKAALAVAGFMTGFLALNTYWGLGGTAGVAWVLGCDCTVPLAAVWVQEAAIMVGIGIVLGRAGIWRNALPHWIFGVGIWAMTATFAAVALLNLLGDNTAQARLLFAPTGLTLSVLCAVVAGARASGASADVSKTSPISSELIEGSPASNDLNTCTTAGPGF